MDFMFSEEQDLLRDTTRRFLREHQPRAQVRRAMAAGSPFEPELWRRGAELGWAAMLVAEEDGGGSVTAQPLVDAIALAEELGRELNPGPFVPCNVVADAIARFGDEGQRRSHLGALARGEAVGALCLGASG